MHWILLPYRRYFDFSGRSSRREFWLFFAVQILALLVLASWICEVLTEIGRQGVTGHSVETFAELIGPAFTAFGIFSLVTLIPALAVQVRRLHDQNLSALLMLVHLVPGIGSLLMLILMGIRGTNGSNRYGPDPLANARRH